MLAAGPVMPPALPCSKWAMSSILTPGSPGTCCSAAWNTSSGHLCVRVLTTLPHPAHKSWAYLIPLRPPPHELAPCLTFHTASSAFKTNLESTALRPPRWFRSLSPLACMPPPASSLSHLPSLDPNRQPPVGTCGHLSPGTSFPQSRSLRPPCSSPGPVPSAWSPPCPCLVSSPSHQLPPC